MHVGRRGWMRVAVGAFVLGLCACGSGTSGTADSVGDADSQGTTDAREITPAEAVEPGSDTAVGDQAEAFVDAPADVLGDVPADVPVDVPAEDDVENPPNCPHEYVDGCFVCNDGQLISVNWVCNGGADCFDGSDEYPMNEACDDPSGTCGELNPALACNWQKDCPDGSDEYPVNPACDPVAWCADGMGIPVEAACDGLVHCLDRSDEGPVNADCPSTFTCADGTPLYTRAPACNGSPQCADGSDERPGNPDCPAWGSCAGSCGGRQASGCWCDALCATWGDCCPDRCDACADTCEPPPAGQCQGKPLPAGTTCVPGGTFTDTHWTGPNIAHVIPTLAMDTTEVTAAAYQHCIAAGICIAWVEGAAGAANSLEGGTGDHPINFVNFLDARTFCEWAGKRLPTEWEWEWAARGREAGTVFPWGNAEIDPSDVCMWPLCQGTCAVGSHSPASDSPDGVQDLAGNVDEWVWGQRENEFPALRGGGCATSQTPDFWVFLPSMKAWFLREGGTGFRCVKTL